MKLNDLLHHTDIENLAHSFFEKEIFINKVTDYSANVEKGNLFVAIPSENVQFYIQQAVAAGACAIITQKEIAEALYESDISIPILVTPHCRLTLSKLARAFYPKSPHSIVAVTGTNGKSSVVNMVRQLCAADHYKAASLGTFGLKTSPEQLNIEQGITLPSLNSLDSLNFFRTLNYLKENDIDHLAFEASSHGLDQYRQNGVQLTAAGFTNLTQDHLDYHKDMDSYFAAKVKLFREILAQGKTAVLNMDSPYFSRLQLICDEAKHQILSYSITQVADLHISNIQHKENYILFNLNSRGQKFSSLRLNMKGSFQLENLLCAMGLALSAGISFDSIISAIPLLEGIPGRMERVAVKDGAEIFIDYAHTPDALETVLKDIKTSTHSKVVLVFGCGGDRDKEKRPIMGKVAQDLADTVIITDDNPRNENPSSIRQSILKSCPKAIEIADRKKAIITGIEYLQSGDILLIAGKGHETGQIVNGKNHPFNDKVEILKYLQENKYEKVAV